MTRVAVKPELLRWARGRAGVSVDTLVRKFPKVNEWEREEVQPTLRQLEAFAKATLTPVGYFFLAEPPEERLPIPDFRTRGDGRMARPSPNLLEMVYVCQQRQEWFREYTNSMGSDPAGFVGSATLDRSVEETAGRMREALEFDLDERRDFHTWTEALRRFIGQADALGVLVMCSGVVLNNNRRALDPDEFCGFAIVDALAPLVFINGADTKAAQMFTLAHELAHLWLGQSALSDAGPGVLPDNAVEVWCNGVAAELLVPLHVLRAEYREDAELTGEVNRLARRFKVSTLVALRRIYDVGGLSRAEFREAYDAERGRLIGLSKTSGGDFYLTQAARVSRRFARALIESTLEGHTLYRDAFRLLGISKAETFRELGRSLKFPM